MYGMRWWLVLGVALIGLSSAARAQDVLDQHTVDVGCSGGDHQIQYFERTGMTFIPRGPNLTAVEVNLVRYNAPFSDTITLSVVQGSVTGAFVASASRTLTSPPDQTGFYRFTFASPVAITPGLTHSFVLDATNPSWGVKNVYELGNGCGYADGNAFTFGEAFQGNDMRFRTYTLCGNGAVDLAEQCDDGNADSTDGCTTSCTICGDGVLTAPEQCDDGNTTDGDGCNADCTLPSCGDGVVQAPEECDDGNDVNGDCCSRGCRRVPAGDGCGSDDNRCTDQTCNAAGACVPSPNSELCDDNNPCNGADSCGGGSCSVHTGDPCAAAGECGGHCTGDSLGWSCVRTPANTPCTPDNDVCTTDVCNGSGSCTHPQAPNGTECGGADCRAGVCNAGTCELFGASTCDPCLVCDGNGGCIPPTGLSCLPPSPRGSTVSLKNDESDADRDALSWSWKVDSGTTKADFGTPLTSTSYSVCVFDHDGFVTSARIPADGSCGTKPCWSDVTTGFKYRNRYLTPDGIVKLELKASASGQGKIKVRGKGHLLGVPSLGLATPVTVRLIGSDVADCWEAAYSTASRNDVERFKAKTD